jgi:hypothetical protein
MNVSRSRRPAADNAGLRGCELAVQLTQEIVFPAMHRRRAPAPEGRMIAAAAVSSVGAGRASRPQKRLLPRALSAGQPRETKRPQSLRAGRGDPLRPCQRRRRSACSWPRGWHGPSLRPRRRFGAGRDWRAAAPATLPIALSPEVSEPDGCASPCRDEPPLLSLSEAKGLMSAEHFSVDGTLIKAWASMKSFRPKDGSGHPPPNRRLPSRASRSP